MMNMSLEQQLDAVNNEFDAAAEIGNRAVMARCAIEREELETLLDAQDAYEATIEEPLYIDVAWRA